MRTSLEGNWRPELRKQRGREAVQVGVIGDRSFTVDVRRVGHIGCTFCHSVP